MICQGCGVHRKKSCGPCDLCQTIEIPEKEKKSYKIPKKSEKQKAITRKDIEFFESIWNTRPHYSQVSGEFLGHEFNVCFFAHVLPKGAYPKFRNLEVNILLMTFDEHQEYDHSDFPGPKWDRVRALGDKLVELYYKYE
jgi:hypothetical protein